MNKLGQIFLRIGLAFVLIYAGVSAQINPDAWIGFIPSFLQELIGGELLLKVHSVGNIILGLWLLSGWRVFYPAFFSALFMAGIIIFNFGALDIIFRDVGLFFTAIALAVLSREKSSTV